MHVFQGTRRRVTTIAAAGLMAVGAAAAIVIGALPAAAATICEQFGTVDSSGYVIMNNRWGTSATQCINTTATGFTIQQQDGTGNTSGAPTAYPAIYLGCHYSRCSTNTQLPAQISSFTTANTSISNTYPSSGTWDAAYDIWLNANNDVSGVQDTEIMVWLNHQGSIQPVGSSTGSANIAGRTWTVWTGNNGQNNVVSYVASSAISSITFNVRDFINDTFSRGSQYGNTSWWLTSIQAGFEPWIGGVGLTVNTFSASVGGGGGQVPGTPGTPSASNVTASSLTLNWAASSGTVSNYLIERATGATSTSFSQVGTSTTTSFNDSGLAANTTYRYRVRASNSAGTSGFSAITNVTTSSGGGQVPGAPGTPSASNVTASSLSLNWAASSGTVTNYQIERATGATSTSFSQVGTSTTTSFNDSGLAASTTYRYRVRAANSSGTSAYSAITNVTTSSGGGGGGGACTTTTSVQSQWSNGYVLNVTVTNTGTSTINGWTSTVTLPSGHAHTGSWPAAATVSGQNVTERNLSWNGTLAPGQTTTWGFQASRPNNTTALPTTFSCTSP